MKYLSSGDKDKHQQLKRPRQKKLMKLPERQDRPKGKQVKGSVNAHDDVERPVWVKHPFRDKFNETHFFADIDILLLDPKNRSPCGGPL